MRVRRFRINGQEVQNSRKDTVKQSTYVSDTENALLRIKESILFNSQAKIQAGETVYQAKGSAIDVATIEFLQDADIPVHLFVQRKYENEDMGEIALQSSKRWASVAVIDHEETETVRIYVKGAPEEVLQFCGTHANGEELDKDQEEAAIRELGKKALKCISFAYFESDKGTFDGALDNAGSKQMALQSLIDDNMGSFTYLLTLGLKDDLRETVVEDVRYA